MSSLIDMSGDVGIDEDFQLENARSPGPRSHLRSVEALQANLRVVKHFFAKQVGQSDKSQISKPRIIAVYPYGLKFVTEPPEEQFEPEYIADLFDSAFLFKFVEISKFRFDAGKSEFAFTYVKPATALEHSTTTEFVFRSFSVLDIKDVINKLLQQLQARAIRLAQEKSLAALGPSNSTSSS